MPSRSAVTWAACQRAFSWALFVGGGQQPHQLGVALARRADVHRGDRLQRGGSGGATAAVSMPDIA